MQVLGCNVDFDREFLHREKEKILYFLCEKGTFSSGEKQVLKVQFSKEKCCAKEMLKLLCISSV